MTAFPEDVCRVFRCAGGSGGRVWAKPAASWVAVSLSEAGRRGVAGACSLLKRREKVGCRHPATPLQGPDSLP
ncbi:MAG: hypothetical protein MJY44_05435 [Bacteroidales bacterium]|nr:hypothetical protein [Bacteroidales bacterium]